jgi:hypothetical protein
VGQLVHDAVGHERKVDTVKGAAEAFEHPGEAGDDIGEAVEHTAGAKGLGVVAYRLEAQYVLAFGVGLQRQEPAVDLEDGQAVLGCLGHAEQLRPSGRRTYRRAWGTR